MLDDSPPGCPWCSATFAPGATVCPSCGANLTGTDAAEIPGVTEIDMAAVGVARPPAIRSRSRWRSWISGEVTSDALTERDVRAVALPDDAVRTEMLRLELAARVVRLQAEADALLADAAEEARTTGIRPGDHPPGTADPQGATAGVDDQAEPPQSADQPIADQPIQDQPIQDQPIADQPIQDQPTAEADRAI